MTPEPDIVHRFKAQLVAARPARRSSSSRRRWVLAVCAAAVAAAAFFAALPAGDDGPRPGQALAVTRAAGDIVIRIADASASPDRIERELRAVGITASVATEPVSPSLVGTWTAVTASPPLRDAAREHAEIARGVKLRIPEGYSGRLTLRVGRAARPGDELRMSISAFRPGEPLHCSGVERLSPDRAAREIARLGLVPRWERLAIRRGEVSEPGKDDRIVDAMVPVLVDAPPRGRIIDARLLSSGYPEAYGRPDGTTLLLTVAPPGLDPPRGTYRVPRQRC